MNNAAEEIISTAKKIGFAECFYIAFCLKNKQVFNLRAIYADKDGFTETITDGDLFIAIEKYVSELRRLLTNANLSCVITVNTNSNQIFLSCEKLDHHF
jgi:hypothetical protein